MFAYIDMDSDGEEAREAVDDGFAQGPNTSKINFAANQHLVLAGLIHAPITKTVVGWKAKAVSTLATKLLLWRRQRSCLPLQQK